jgi:hypothetical protein
MQIFNIKNPLLDQNELYKDQKGLKRGTKTPSEGLNRDSTQAIYTYIKKLEQYLYCSLVVDRIGYFDPYSRFAQRLSPPLAAEA